MKTAKVRVLLASLECPHCGDIILNPDTFSHDWEPTQVGTGTVICDKCETRARFPKIS